MFSVIIQTHSRTTQPHLPTNAYKKNKTKKTVVHIKKLFDSLIHIHIGVCTVVSQ